MAGKYTREDLDRYFDYSVFPARRALFLGSHSDVDGDESGIDYQGFASFLKGITYLDGVSQTPITIHMNSIGGDWYHGMAMYDAIRACQSHVTIIAWGYSCSMASVILQAADLRVLTPSCVVMVHDGEDGVHADAKSFEAWGKQSARTRRTMYHIYLERMRYKNARLTVKEVETMCSHDRIFSAEEAVNAGLADMVMNTFVDITSGIGSGKKYVPVPNKGAKRR